MLVNLFARPSGDDKILQPQVAANAPAPAAPAVPKLDPFAGGPVDLKPKSPSPAATPEASPETSRENSSGASPQALLDTPPDTASTPTKAAPPIAPSPAVTAQAAPSPPTPNVPPAGATCPPGRMIHAYYCTARSELTAASRAALDKELVRLARLRRWRRDRGSGLRRHAWLKRVQRRAGREQGGRHGEESCVRRASRSPRSRVSANFRDWRMARIAPTSAVSTSVCVAKSKAQRPAAPAPLRRRLRHWSWRAPASGGACAERPRALSLACFPPQQFQLRPVVVDGAGLHIDQAHGQGDSADAFLVEVLEHRRCRLRPRHPDYSGL